MSAGLLFGSLVGTIIVSISGTAFQVAASVAFLIARYFARERIVKLLEGNKKFLAIDKAIGENGFRVVTLLRLSPLLPFSLGNYLYGLTSVKFIPYVLGSNIFGGNSQLLTLGLGLLATALAATYVTRLAKIHSEALHEVNFRTQVFFFLQKSAVSTRDMDIPFQQSGVFPAPVKSVPVLQEEPRSNEGEQKMSRLGQQLENTASEVIWSMLTDSKVRFADCLFGSVWK
uniref:VTT domain-containing protein n=1 Tax=Phaseolus vulgaris TaxID=3885 RepID=V7AEL3_PHAVU|nr:hypothetical protein PHAVU_011G000600g [Phaseolus vulgaris]ESW03273.1 hypothetical protein PHAVU_011G000600g [Phaseolus vulgaris]